MEVYEFYGTCDDPEPAFRVTVAEEEDYPTEESHNGITSIMVHGHGDDCNAIIMVSGTNADSCNLAWYNARKMYNEYVTKLWP